MNPNKTQQFLVEEPSTIFYIKHLKQSINLISSKIIQQKTKMRELFFNVSMLFGMPASRDKIDEQMNKIGIRTPSQYQGVQAIDALVDKIYTEKLKIVVTKSQIQNGSKRHTPAFAQQGGSPIKKRKTSDDKNLQNLSLLVSYEIKSGSQQNIKQHNSRQNEAILNVNSSNSLKNSNLQQDESR